MNYYYNPVHIFFGNDLTDNIDPLIKELCPLGGKVLFIVWSTEVPVSFKPDNGREIKIITFNKSNPTIYDLFGLYLETSSYLPDAVVAIGGGSVMDAAKSLCCLFGKSINTVDDLRRIIQDRDYSVSSAKWIGVPTTSGTGSEVTCWATIWDPIKNVKYSIEDHNNFAYAAVIDPHLSANMPLKLAVSSALDAAAHAAESYWAKASNIISKALALSAIKTITANFEGLFEGSTRAGEYMAKGSVTAGLAFSATKTTACHSISYPLTMKYNIPHGVAVSMLLAPVMRLNQDNIEEYEMLLEALGVNSASELKHKINGILNRAGIPCTLKEWGVDKEDMPKLAPYCITKGRADNNPVCLTEEKILSILNEIY